MNFRFLANLIGAFALTLGSAMAAVNPRLVLPRTDHHDNLTRIGLRDPGIISTSSTAADSTRLLLVAPARQAEVDGYLDMAARFESGRGVAADPIQAFAYYQAAALRGDGYAQEQLGMFYEIGRGVSRDVEQALRWYHVAAEKNFPAAQLSLIRLLSRGKDVAPRPEQAYMWTIVALSNPNLPAAVRASVLAMHETLELQLHPQQVDAAKNRAREWKLATPIP